MTAVAFLAELFLVGWLLGGGASPRRESLTSTPSAESSPAPPPPLAIEGCEPTSAVPPSGGTLDLAGEIDLGMAVAGADGLAYLPAARLLAFGGASPGQINLVTLFGDRAGSVPLPDGVSGRMASGDRALMVLNADAERLDVVALTASGGIAADVALSSMDLRAAGLQGISGVDVDPNSERLLIMAAEEPRILSVPLETLSRGGSVLGALVSSCTFDISGAFDAAAATMAVQPSTGHLILAEAERPVLRHLAVSGEPIATLDLAQFGVESVHGLAVAPSADPTDPDVVDHLYVLVQVEGGSSHLMAFSFTAVPDPPVAPTIVGVVARQLDTAAASPPSSDPAGIAYDAATRTLVICDVDIDELPEFEGHTVFGLGMADDSWTGMGRVANGRDLAGVAIDPGGRQWFFADDSGKEIFVVTEGPDTRRGTSDDRIARFSTEDFGSVDPEGLAFGQNSLFIADGVSAQVYRLSPGTDGIFNGATPSGDDEVISFDTSVLGLADPEGLEFDSERGTLYVLDRKGPRLFEVATNGELVSIISIEDAGLVSPAGLTLAPALDGSGSVSLFIVDRGTDNARSSVPNDGRIVEIQLGRAVPGEP